MQNLATYTRPAFLGGYPPVLARMIIDSDGTENTYLAGSVLGRDSEEKLGLWTADNATVCGILAGDVTVSASGGATVDVYIHANVVADAYIFADGVSAADEKACLVALREKGIYSSVTWATPNHKAYRLDCETYRSGRGVVMASFEISYALVKEFEGSYSNDKNDSGETYSGIARNFSPTGRAGALSTSTRKLWAAIPQHCPKPLQPCPGCKSSSRNGTGASGGIALVWRLFRKALRMKFLSNR